MLLRTDHIEIVPRNFEASLAFYTDLLGFALAHRYPVDAPPYQEIAYLTQGDIGLELLRIESPRPRQEPNDRAGFRCIAWEVQDMESLLETLGNKGIEATWGPLRTEAFIRAEIRDPDGNPIELRQWFRRPGQGVGA
ncbi:MAG: VOC family protein [Pseudomonadota bacterium]|nr:VOC family protein [Pseudomonadota bacterium]